MTDPLIHWPASKTRKDLSITATRLYPSALLPYSLSVVLLVVSLGMFVLLLLVALSMASPYVKIGKDQQHYVKTVLSYEQKMTKTIRTFFPVKIEGHDVTGWMILVGSLALGIWFNGLSYRFRKQANYIQYKKSMEEIKKKHVSEFAIQSSSIGEKLDNLKTASKKDREQIIREFAETKRKLDEMGRDLAFLAIDIADSTGMKVDEEKVVVQHDFMQYRNFVSQILADHKCLKSTWTPDGVMTCFPAVDGAVQAATAIIDGLEAFNRDVKQMRRDFSVRCGVNAGFVIFDESMPQEMISDRAIDIAGHMQKHAEPNTVNIAKQAIEPLTERMGFSPSGKVVDGYEVYAWQKS